MKAGCLFFASWVTLLSQGSAWGQFIPGHVFVSDGSANFCKDISERDFIWEVNPDTGSVEVFVEIPAGLCGVVTGLAFSPDGRRLRVRHYSFGSD